MAIVLGYHGCSTTAAQALLSGSSFERSNKPYDWLGSGAYFWEDDPVRAYQWALDRRSQAPCVVGAVIELGHCLDLTKQSGIRAVLAAYASYIEMQRQAKEPVPENKAANSSSPGDFAIRRLDRAVIDHLHQLNAFATLRSSGTIREFDTVRAMFPEGARLYKNSGFLKKTHVQIAVKNPRQILGVFRIPDHQLQQLGIPTLYDF